MVVLTILVIPSSKTEGLVRRRSSKYCIADGHSKKEKEIWYVIGRRKYGEEEKKRKDGRGKKGNLKKDRGKLVRSLKNYCL